MFDVIITVATTEPDDISRSAMDAWVRANPTEHVVTKVYRFEFETRDAIQQFLLVAKNYSITAENLTALAKGF